jgi:hypothetical protein
MAMIYIACPDCTADTSMPARALLATLDLGGLLEPLGHMSWVCLSCGRLVTADLEVAHLLNLLTAGVSLLDDGFGGSTVAMENTDCGASHVERPGTGPQFTLQDVLTLHELLETEAWVQQLADPMNGSS